MQARPVYIYTDETGQETKGEWLVVVAIVVTDYRRRIEGALEEVERSSGKGGSDWRSTNPKRLRKYLEEALALPELRGCVLYRKYEGLADSDYHGRGIETALDAADKFGPVSKGTFVPEGFNRADRSRLEAQARARFPKAEVWASGFRGSALVRLADSAAGLVACCQCKAESRKSFPDLLLPDVLVALKNEPPARTMNAPGGEPHRYPAASGCAYFRKFRGH